MIETWRVPQNMCIPVYWDLKKSVCAHDCIREILFIISLKKDLCNVLVIDLNASYILKVYQLTHALVKISSRGLLEGLNHRFLLLWFLNSGRFLYLQLENPLRTCFQVSIIILLDCVYWCIGMNNDVFKQIKVY